MYAKAILAFCVPFYNSYILEHRYARSPVTRVPPELILAVAPTLCEDDPPIPPKSGKKAQSLGWIVISHICTKWRRICLGTPGLWAGNLGTVPLAIPTLLERTGDRIPLDIVIKLWEASNHDWIEFCDFAHSRIRSIFVETPVIGFRLSSFLYRMLVGKELPLLERLYINLIGIGEKWIHYPAPISAPILREAVMYNSFLPMKAPLLTLLTVDDLIGGRGRGSIEALLQILSASPLLQELSVRIIASSPEELTAIPYKIHLRHLLSLKIDDFVYAESISILLDKLHLTGKASIRVSALNAYQPTGFSPSTALTSIASSISQQHTVKGLAVLLGHGFMHLRLYSRTSLNLGRPSLSLNELTFKAELAMRCFSLASELRLLSENFDLRSIDIFSIQGKHNHLSGFNSDVDWTDVFEVFHTIKTLHVVNVPHTHQSEIFLPLSTHRDGDPARLLLPQLEQLRIGHDIEKAKYAYTFRGARKSSMVQLDFRLDLTNLINALAKRAASSIPGCPRPLSVHVGPALAQLSPEITAIEVEELRALVSAVHWGD